MKHDRVAHVCEEEIDRAVRDLRCLRPEWSYHQIMQCAERLSVRYALPVIDMLGRMYETEARGERAEEEGEGDDGQTPDHN